MRRWNFSIKTHPHERRIPTSLRRNHVFETEKLAPHTRSDTSNMAHGCRVVRIQIKLSLFMHTYTQFDNMAGISRAFYGKTRVMLCVHLHSEWFIRGSCGKFSCAFFLSEEHLKASLRCRVSREPSGTVGYSRLLKRWWKYTMVFPDGGFEWKLIF